jgi:hypothetical protein
VLTGLVYRFCSRSCVNKFFGSENDSQKSQEFTPSSSSGISLSSDTVIDLAQGGAEEEPETTNSIPEHIGHGPPRNSINPVWGLIHQLKEPVTLKCKQYTHICLLCLKTKTWKDSLCRASNTTNAKSHLIAGHKEHEMAVKEQNRRKSRATSRDG